MTAGTLLLVLACGSPGLSLAAEQANCTDLAAQQDRNACISKATAKADEALNRVYLQLTAKLDALGRRNLTAAERAWITFRDRECAFRAGYDRDASANTGTIVPFLVGQCRLELTEARALARRAIAMSWRGHVLHALNRHRDGRLATVDPAAARRVWKTPFRSARDLTSVLRKP